MSKRNHEVSILLSASIRAAIHAKAPRRTVAAVAAASMESAIRSAHLLAAAPAVTGVGLQEPKVARDAAVEAAKRSKRAANRKRRREKKKRLALEKKATEDDEMGSSNKQLGSLPDHGGRSDRDADSDAGALKPHPMEVQPAEPTQASERPQPFLAGGHSVEAQEDGHGILEGSASSAGRSMPALAHPHVHAFQMGDEVTMVDGLETCEHGGSWGVISALEPNGKLRVCLKGGYEKGKTVTVPVDQATKKKIPAVQSWQNRTARRGQRNWKK